MVKSRAVEAPAKPPRTRNFSILGVGLTIAIALAIGSMAWHVIMGSELSTEEVSPNPSAAPTPTCSFPARFWKDRLGKDRPVSELMEIESRHMLWISSNHSQGEKADLSGADLSCVDLRDYNFNGADLTGARFSRANLSHANLIAAQGATDQACGRNPNCSVTNLTEAELTGAQLQEADFTGATLVRSDLTLAIFSNQSQLFDADVDGAIFEPTEPEDAVKLNLADLTYPAKHLWKLTYRQDPKELTHLATEFHNDGRKEQERQVIYAIQHARVLGEWNACLPWKDEATLWTGHHYVAVASNCMAASVNKLIFDLPFQYGWNPYRPLYIIAAVWLVCGIFYAVIMRTRRRRSAIVLVCRRECSDGRTIVHRRKIVLRAPDSRNALAKVSQTLRRELAVWGVALFFSLESALNIGFQEFQFGRWLRLLTTHEYDLKATGWARTIAGTQSLLSLLMLALAIWALFGTPFAS